MPFRTMSDTAPAETIRTEKVQGTTLHTLMAPLTPVPTTHRPRLDLESHLHTFWYNHNAVPLTTKKQIYLKCGLLHLEKDCTVILCTDLNICLGNGFDLKKCKITCAKMS